MARKILMMNMVTRNLIWRIGILGGSVLLLFFWLYTRNDSLPVTPHVVTLQERTDDTEVLREEQPGEVSPGEGVSVTALPASAYIEAVPFTVQAPNGEWNNPLFQDGCEEAVLVMAAAWVNGTKLTKAGVKKEIESLSDFEVEQFDQAVDASLADTEFLLNTYFGITTAKLQTEVSIEDMKRAVAEGKIVIVPTDGRRLKNPNFKQPGPPRHMLVIVGYDDAAKEFFVNDPGTRKGEGYRYKESVLFDALLDYPTGNHAPVTSTDKVALMVSRD